MFDKTYRLLEEQIADPDFGNQTISYTYDPAGNRLTKNDGTVVTHYTYDHNNRLITETRGLEVTTYQYDNNGNTIAKTSPTENTTYTYDYQNRMISANVTVNAIQTILEYQYDTDGIRTQKKINNAVVDFLVDKNREFAQVLEEHDGSGSLTVSYVHGLDLISQIRSGNVSYYHYDGQHSTRQLSNDTAQITDTYVYDAFGLLLQRIGSTLNDYLYTGEQYDPNVGFYYLRARYYNPEIGRFTTVDPWKGSIYDPVSLHRYTYCHNDPVDFVDWSGEISVVSIFAGAIMMALFNTFHQLFTKGEINWKEVGWAAFWGGVFGGMFPYTLGPANALITAAILLGIILGTWSGILEYIMDEYILK